MTFISKFSVRFSPGRPGPNWRGARLVLDLKRVLPQPPLPPSRHLQLLARGLQVAQLLAGLGVR